MAPRGQAHDPDALAFHSSLRQRLSAAVVRTKSSGRVSPYFVIGPSGVEQLAEFAVWRLANRRI